MFLDSDREVRAALARSVVRHHHGKAPMYKPDTSDDAAAGDIDATVQLVARKLSYLQKRGPGVKQAVYALSGRNFSPPNVPAHGVCSASWKDVLAQYSPQVSRHRVHGVRIFYRMRPGGQGGPDALAKRKF
jgi:hypothetical protein